MNNGGRRTTIVLSGALVVLLAVFTIGGISTAVHVRAQNAEGESSAVASDFDEDAFDEFDEFDAFDNLDQFFDVGQECDDVETFSDFLGCLDEVDEAREAAEELEEFFDFLSCVLSGECDVFTTAPPDEEGEELSTGPGEEIRDDGEPDGSSEITSESAPRDEDSTDRFDQWSPEESNEAA